MNRAAQIGIVCAIFVVLNCATWAFAENLKVSVEGGRLRMAGSQLHFLAGRPLERLRNGAAVTYSMHLTIRNERAGRVLTRLTERFTFSYDLWEEKFAVTRQASPTRSASNLSGSAAEAWCMQNLSVPLTEVPTDRQFWVTVEFESEQSKDESKSDGLTLGSLIDIFSRRQRDEEQIRGFAETGPIRLDDLRKKR